MADKRSWIGRALDDAALEQLARGLSGSELQSVLLETMQERAHERSPADVLAQYGRDGFVRPSPVDQRESVAIDADLLAAADGFDAIELSPVAPLGTCASVALTHQNRVLSALRSTEVVSDPTNVLALECAVRLRKEPRGGAVHFATSHRVVRAQPVPKLPGYAPHFRIFVLASGGIEDKDHGFTVSTVLRHVRTVLSALDGLEKRGYAFGARRVDVLATSERASLGDRIASSLDVPTHRRVLEHPYYSGGIRIMLWVTTPDGSQVPLFDSGVFDWLQQLTSNRRAVFVATGGGAQLIAVRFGPFNQHPPSRT